MYFNGPPHSSHAPTFGPRASPKAYWDQKLHALSFDRVIFATHIMLQTYSPLIKIVRNSRGIPGVPATIHETLEPSSLLFRFLQRVALICAEAMTVRYIAAAVLSLLPGHVTIKEIDPTRGFNN